MTSFKFVENISPTGKPIWFCINADAPDQYTANIASGKMEFPDSCRFIQQYFASKISQKSHQSFLDIGANVGIYTLFMASEGIEVVAIEALAENYAMLCAAIAKNSFPARVIPIHAAATNDFSLLNVEGNSAWGHVSSKGNLVAGLPVSKLLQRILKCTPSIVKIDVEGYEGVVLAGMRPLMDQGTDIVVEVFATQMDALASLEEAGYSAYLIVKDRLLKTSATKFNSPFVADYFCTKGMLGDRVGGYEIHEYSDHDMIELAQIEAACPVAIHRKILATRLKAGPHELRNRQEICDIMVSLRNDPDPSVAEAAR